jgi:hypothetical protein
MRAKRLCVIAALFLALVGGALFWCRDAFFRRLAERSIRDSTGLRAEIGELQSSLGPGRFTVRDLKLYNLAEFGGSLLASIPELSVDLDGPRAADGIFHLRLLTLKLAELHVVKDASGRLNLDGVEKAVRVQVERRIRSRKNKEEVKFGGIDRLQLTLRHVHYTDLTRPDRTHSFDLGLNDEVVTSLKTESDLQTWVGMMLFRILMQQSFKSLAPGPGSEPEAPAAQ